MRPAKLSPAAAPWKFSPKCSERANTMPSILDNIYAAKRVEVRARRAVVSPMAIVAEAGRAPKPRDFVAALRGRRPAIVAEIKRASPSKGDIMPGLDPVKVAREYVACGGAGISL